MLTNAIISEQTKALTILEKDLVAQHNLTLVFAIDPWDSAVQRTRIHQLPTDYDPRKGILDKRLQTALSNYAIYVVTNYEPDYLLKSICSLSDLLNNLLLLLMYMKKFIEI